MEKHEKDEKEHQEERDRRVKLNDAEMKKIDNEVTEDASDKFKKLVPNKADDLAPKVNGLEVAKKGEKQVPKKGGHKV